MDDLQWETLLKWDDLGVPSFLETPKWWERHDTVIPTGKPI